MGSWTGWDSYPQLKSQLLGDGGKLDGMFWMTFDNFVARYSDCGIVPKAMEVPRMGQVEHEHGTGTPQGGKHGRRPQGAPSIGVFSGAPAADQPKAKKEKKRG